MNYLASIAETVRKPASEQESLTWSVVVYFLRTAAFTMMFMIGISFIAIVFTAIIITGSDPLLGGFIFSSFLGWSVLFGQKAALGGIPESEDDDLSAITSTLQTIASGLYYNLMTFIAVVIAGATYMNGYPAVAVGTAFLIPVADYMGSAKYGIGVAYFLTTAAIIAGRVVTDVYEQIPAKQLLHRSYSLVKQFLGALPASLHLLYLPWFTLWRAGNRKRPRKPTRPASR